MGDDVEATSLIIKWQFSDTIYGHACSEHEPVLGAEPIEEDTTSPWWQVQTRCRAPPSPHKIIQCSMASLSGRADLCADVVVIDIDIAQCTVLPTMQFYNMLCSSHQVNLWHV